MELIKCEDNEVCPRCERQSIDSLYQLVTCFSCDNGPETFKMCICCWQDLSRAITTVIWDVEVAH